MNETQPTGAQGDNAHLAFVRDFTPYRGSPDPYVVWHAAWASCLKSMQAQAETGAQDERARFDASDFDFPPCGKGVAALIGSTGPNSNPVAKVLQDYFRECGFAGWKIARAQAAPVPAEPVKWLVGTADEPLSDQAAWGHEPNAEERQTLMECGVAFVVTPLYAAAPVSAEPMEEPHPCVEAARLDLLDALEDKRLELKDRDSDAASLLGRAIDWIDGDLSELPMPADAPSVREALAELVALKKLKERLAKCWPDDPEAPELRRAYSERKGLAWAAAEAALAGHQGETK